MIYIILVLQMHDRINVSMVITSYRGIYRIHLYEENKVGSIRTQQPNADSTRVQDYVPAPKLSVIASHLQGAI